MTHTFTIQTGSDYALEAVKRFQDSVLEVFKGQVTAFNRLVPEKPTMAKISDLPSAKELVQESFEFQARLLEANRAFSVSLAEAVADFGAATSEVSVELEIPSAKK